MTISNTADTSWEAVRRNPILTSKALSHFIDIYLYTHTHTAYCLIWCKWRQTLLLSQLHPQLFLLTLTFSHNLHFKLSLNHSTDEMVMSLVRCLSVGDLCCALSVQIQTDAFSFWTRRRTAPLACRLLLLQVIRNAVLAEITAWRWLFNFMAVCKSSSALSRLIQLKTKLCTIGIL